MRLIDADKLYLHLNNWALAESPTGFEDDELRKEREIICRTINDFMKAVEEQPTAYDIVRCKDCKYWVRASLEGFYRTSQVPACELAGWLCGEDGFCLYGVRKKVE